MPTPMTVAGAEALREELTHRKGTQRQEITAIAEARAHGDLKENAEYHAAREQQGFNEGRIQEIESRLADAQVIDVTAIPAGEKVIFGGQSRCTTPKLMKVLATRLSVKTKQILSRVKM